MVSFIEDSNNAYQEALEREAEEGRNRLQLQARAGRERLEREAQSRHHQSVVTEERLLFDTDVARVKAEANRKIARRTRALMIVIIAAAIVVGVFGSYFSSKEMEIREKIYQKQISK